MSRIILSAASRVGCIRSNNEDMVLAYNRFVRSDAYETEFMTENMDRFVIALADGMGGHHAGEVASEETLSSLQFYLGDLPRNMSSGEFCEKIQEWHQYINNKINLCGNSTSSRSVMGTTLVGVLSYGGRYYWINCGDSRFYRFRDGHLSQLSSDHSLNTMTGQTKHSNVITNCIGAGCKNSYLDFFDFTDDFLSGDTYLICSDGLNDMIPDTDIECLMQEGASANQLCVAAIEAGGFDNVSTCVFHIQ